MGDIRKMFNPETIALIGATQREGSVGRSALENVLASKRRKIYPVNPKRKTVLGVECYPRIGSVPEKVDLAIIATPAQTVADHVEECGEAGVEGIIIFSAGFREVGEEGKLLEDRIAGIRARYGMRIVGPNCLGIIRPNVGLNASFWKLNPEPGNIALISQIGGLGDAMVDYGKDTRIGFSMFASLGSMIDVDFGDLIDFLGDDYETRSIMFFMESVGNAKKFLSAARGFARSKPMVILKPGVFEESLQAMISHTGMMTGHDRVYDAAFKRVGCVRVREIADLFAMAQVLDSTHLPRGPKLAIISNAGSLGVVAADTLLRLGGTLARLSGESVKKLNEILPPAWSKGNPIDIVGDADVGRYIRTVDACLSDPDVDGILVIFAPRLVTKPEELAEAIIEKSRTTTKQIVATGMGGKDIQKALSALSHNHIPTYDTPEEAVKTYLYMYNYKRNLELLYETPSELSVGTMSPKFHLKALIQKARNERSLCLDQEGSLDFLRNYGIAKIKTRLARTVEEAQRVAKEIGYPVCLKVVSADIRSKTDVNGVIFDITSDAALKEAYAALTDNVRKFAPHARLTGIAVQKMLERVDHEVMLGCRKDGDFGSVIIFGKGGVDTEIFKDFSVGLPPLNQTLARRLMEETEVYGTLKGYRGRAPADLRQLEEMIVNFSNLIVDFPEIAEMEINPIAVSDGKAYALDARIVIDGDEPDRSVPYPHLVITPYPTRYVMPAALSDGTEVLLRPIRPEDEPLEREMLTSLSERTLRERFFSVVKDITHDMLIRFCNIDYEREMAIVVEIKEAVKRRIVGIGRLIVDPGFKSSQFAVLVHDDFQGKGLGYMLLDMMIGIAQEKGLEEIYGIVLTDNQRMLQICKTLGFFATKLPDGISRVTLALK